MGNVSFSWASGPAAIELEMVVMNWIADMFGLPDAFKFIHGNHGGGMTQPSASDVTFISLLSAKAKALSDYLESHPGEKEEDVMGRLIAYGSEHVILQNISVNILVLCYVPVL